MLRMSKLTDYGIVLLTHMAMGAEGALHTANELADISGVPLPTASKILKELSRAGLVLSHRGRHGGYSLSRPARDIAVSDIIAALEGPVALTECGEAAGLCGIEESCPARGHWSAINDTIQRALGGLTLSALQPPLVRLGPAPTNSGTMP
jgi:FeS assembly SUF system regulator